MMTNTHITFILNPTAGRGKAQHTYQSLTKLLQNSSLRYSLKQTTKRGEATQIARESSRDSKIIVAIGGDGTVNEVASGLLGTDAALAVLSVGSGNDFARMINAPKDPGELLQILNRPIVQQLDCGKTLLTHSNQSQSEKLFFNSLGIGFDAAVAKNVSSIRWLRGIPLYFLALLKTMIGYRPHHLLVRTEKEEWRKDYFLLCVGNGKWEGGGFMLTPNAQPNDGVFEVCGAACHSILRILPILPFVMFGKHIGRKYIENLNTRNLIVESENPFPVHGDGEIFGLDIKKVEIQLIFHSLNVVMPHTQ